MRLTLIVALLAPIFAATGCVAVQSGTTQVKWEPGEKTTRVIPALDTGKYALLKGTDYKPQMVVWVNAGQNIGFEQEGSKVYAVYGDKRDVIGDPDSRYYWNYRGK